MQKKLIKKTKKISKNRNNTKKYKTQRGGSTQPLKKAKIENEQNDSTKPSLSKKSSLSTKSSFVFTQLVYGAINEKQRSEIDKIMKEYNDFKGNVEPAVSIVNNLSLNGYNELDPAKLPTIFQALGIIQQGIEIFTAILAKLSGISTTYYDREKKGEFKPIIDYQAELIKLLNQAETNFPVKSKDSIKTHALNRYKIDLDMAYTSKQTKAAAAPNTYKNFVIAEKIFSSIKLYYNYLTYVNNPDIKTVYFIDCENMIMRNYQSKKGKSREASYENLIKNIEKTHINPDEIIILVNRTDISQDNELFGKLTDKLFYVNAKCMGHDNCEADDFLMMIMLHDMIGKKECKIMSHDRYNWLAHKPTRFTINTSGGPIPNKIRNSSITSTNNIRKSARIFAETYTI
jgi:hypothetical protein